MNNQQVSGEGKREGVASFGQLQAAHLQGLPINCLLRPTEAGDIDLCPLAVATLLSVGLLLANDRTCPVLVVVVLVALVLAD